jgi:ESS family glutamate:Na+ symporter
METLILIVAMVTNRSNIVARRKRYTDSLVSSTIPIFKLNPVQVIALAGAGVAIGIWLKRKLPVLDRLLIPAAIVGGMVFAAISLLLHDRFLNLEVDSTLRDVLLIASFTTIGMNASLRVLRLGGVQVVILAAVAGACAVAQAAVGMGLAKLFGLDPRTGILAGTVALSGGPATALAFGPLFESQGVPGATTLALASATFGITVAGLVAGWTGGSLIQKSGLRQAADPGPNPRQENPDRAPLSLSAHILLIAVAMGLGNLISLGVQSTGIVLPSFVGAMVAAVIVRNLDERFAWFGIRQETIEQILGILLPLFIAMAMLTLKLWELTAIAFPLFVILLAEVAITLLFCVFLTYRAMGSDYEAAVATAGFCGFMLGITPNAMASMEELREKFGPAPRAFLVVPLVGAFLIDLINAAIITACANFFR